MVRWRNLAVLLALVVTLLAGAGVCRADEPALEQGSLLYEQGDFEAAMPLLRQAAQTETTPVRKAWALARLGMAMQLHAETSGNPAEAKSALERLEQARQLAPEDPTVLNLYGMGMFGAKEYAKARDALNKSYTLKPDMLTARLARLAEGRAGPAPQAEPQQAPPQGGASVAAPEAPADRPATLLAERVAPRPLVGPQAEASAGMPPRVPQQWPASQEVNPAGSPALQAADGTSDDAKPATPPAPLLPGSFFAVLTSAWATLDEAMQAAAMLREQDLPAFVTLQADGRAKRFWVGSGRYPTLEAAKAQAAKLGVELKAQVEAIMVEQKSVLWSSGG